MLFGTVDCLGSSRLAQCNHTSLQKQCASSGWLQKWNQRFKPVCEDGRDHMQGPKRSCREQSVNPLVGRDPSPITTRNQILPAAGMSLEENIKCQIRSQWVET